MLVPVAAARRLLLRGADLLADPDRPATPARLGKALERLGFVQVDTISVVERAHHLILRTRFDGYRPETLTTLLERRRGAFEHWTHDASIIPACWLPQWKARFARYRARGPRATAWWHERIGPDAERTIAHVQQRIAAEGPLRSRDFEQPRGAVGGNGHGSSGAAGWWNWKPAKAALEYLWRSGTLAVTRRDEFQKVYDLMERVFPQVVELPEPDPIAHLDWACATALDRLGVATPKELAGFFAAIGLAPAQAWCDEAVRDGRAVPVRVESADGSAPQPAVAHPQWRRRAAAAPAAPLRVRPLSPFDPLVRDRARLLRRFGFDYRFEAFVPVAKRRHGYYVLPLLEGERLVGRLDAKAQRERGVLAVRGLWWEPGVASSRARRARLDEALESMAVACGAGRVTFERGCGAGVQGDFAG